MHSKVSFKVVDTESEDVLLCTHHSSTMSLITSCFGIEVSSSLYELNISDGKIKLSGYISGPCDNLTIKAFQYVYINSRFVCKGPIHKLVNQLAARFECCDQVKAVNGTQNRKRSRPQSYPAFILNISCPRCFYDLAFEPSKTHVEFKDWVPVLALLNKAIQQLWKENISYESVRFAADMMRKDQMSHGDEIHASAEDLGDEISPWNSTMEKTKCTIQNRQSSPGLISSHMNILSKEDTYSSYRKHDITPVCRPFNYFEEEENEIDFTFHTENSVQPWESSLAKCSPQVSKNCEEEINISCNDFPSVKDHFFVNEVSTGKIRSVDVDNSNFSSWWGNDSFEGSLNDRSGSAGIAITSDCEDSSDDVEMVRDSMKPLLKSCSLRRRLPRESSLFTDSGHDIRSAGFKMKKMLTEHCDEVNISEIDSNNQSFDILSRTLWQDKESSFQHFPRVARKYDWSAEFDSLPEKSITFYEESVDGIRNDVFSSYSVEKVDTTGSDNLDLNSKWCFLGSDSFSRGTLWDVEDYTDTDLRKGSCTFVNTSRHKHFTDDEEKDCRYSYDVLGKRSSQENCTTSCSNSRLDDVVSGRFLRSHKFKNKFSPECMDISTDERDWLSFDSPVKSHKSIAMHKSQRDTCNGKGERYFQFSKNRSARSHSCPPFYKSKRRFFALNCQLSSKADKGPAYPETPEHLKSTSAGDSSLHSRLDLKNVQDLKEDNHKMEKDETFEKSSRFDIQDAALQKESISKELQDSPDCWTKWQNCCPQIANNKKLPAIQDQSNILDISSGLLHLAGDLLVPESINKNCLEDAIVLQQVDKKFIPIVAGKTLAVVDQHAADERIRLEELRQKVLSGEGRTIFFLEAEQELTLPEIGHQLLHSYAEEIREWGWMCNIHAQDSRFFKRSLNLLHKQPAVVTLVAVPCILGVNLSDVDLMEFLQQLADTDGSSTIPPSVLRILNSKACRGAIMFGDSLLPSECSLLIAELKQTALCFQCAHGRPTTAPLVNLEALHKQIAKIALLNDEVNGLWHGLHRHELTVERAVQRLNSATS